MARTDRITIDIANSISDSLLDKLLEEVPPKGKTAQGLRYSVNQEKYLKVFLTDGNVPMDNLASGGFDVYG